MNHPFLSWLNWRGRGLNRTAHFWAHLWDCRSPPHSWIFSQAQFCAQVRNFDTSNESFTQSNPEMDRALYLYPKTRDRYCRSRKLVQPTAADFYSFLSRTGSRSRKSIILTFQPEVHTTHFPASKVGIPDLKHSGVISVDNWAVRDKDSRHIDNIIYLTGKPGDVLHPFRACRMWCQWVHRRN